MNEFTRRIIRGISNLYRREILRDGPLLEAKRWKKTHGEQRLLDFPLNTESVVIDIGGHIGKFAAAISQRYDCTVHVFEPVQEFFSQCEERFHANPKIHVHHFGLGGADGKFRISIANEASSLFQGDIENGELVEVRRAETAMTDLGIEKIDLIKMNIEGAEYQVLPALLDAGIIAKSAAIAIQFHTIGNWQLERDNIRKRLAETHDEIWCYEFVWEAWQRRN